MWVIFRKRAWMITRLPKLMIVINIKESAECDYPVAAIFLEILTESLAIDFEI